MDSRHGAGVKGLNTSGGSNRFKFQDKQSRAKLVDVDVTHKVRAEGFLDADLAQEPYAEGGTFFQQELDRCKELNVTPPFKRFYYKVMIHSHVACGALQTVIHGGLPSLSMAPCCTAKAINHSSNQSH